MAEAAQNNTQIENVISSKNRALFAAKELQDPYLSQQFALLAVFLLFLIPSLLKKFVNLIVLLGDFCTRRITIQRVVASIFIEMTTLEKLPSQIRISQIIQDSIRRTTTWRKLLIRSVGICLFIFLSEMLVPWNLLEASHKATQDYLYRLVAPNFPHFVDVPDFLKWERDKESEKTFSPLIVMLTDRDQVQLKQEGYPQSWTQWPPDAALYGEILDALIAAQPASIFIDVGFLTDRDNSDICALTDVLETYRQEDPTIPIFLAGDFTEKRTGDIGANYTCAAGIKGRDLEQLDQRLPAGRYEMLPHLLEAGAQSVSVRQAPHHYVLYDCAARRPSAALSLYVNQMDLPFSAKELEAKFCKGDEPENWLGQARNQMSIYWSNRPMRSGIDPYHDPLSFDRTFLLSAKSDQNSVAEKSGVEKSGVEEEETRAREFWYEAYVQPYPCRSLPAPLLTRLFFPVVDELGLVGKGQFFGEIFSKQSCPPHHILSAHTVLNSFEFDVDGSPMQSLVQGNPVLIGADFRMGNDLSLPPTHLAVPGVFNHAMALENLQEMKPLFNSGECLSSLNEAAEGWSEAIGSRSLALDTGCGYLRRAPSFFGWDLGFLYRIASTLLLSLFANFALFRIGVYCQQTVERTALQRTQETAPQLPVGNALHRWLEPMLSKSQQFHIWLFLKSIKYLFCFVALWILSLILVTFVLRWEPETLIDTFLLITFGTAVNLTTYLRAKGRTIDYLANLG